MTCCFREAKARVLERQNQQQQQAVKTSPPTHPHAHPQAPLTGHVLK
jgi:hypothetical protein